MNKLALLTGLWLSTARAADPGACRPDGVMVFPQPGSVVPTNVQWILEGVGSEQTNVADLVGNDVVTLVPSGKDTTPLVLKVEKGWVSQMKRVAVRLKAPRPLSPDTTYTMHFGKPLASATLLSDALGTGVMRWTTAAGPDRDLPKYREKPAVTEGKYAKSEKDGAVERQLTLRADIDESGPAYLLISMQRLRGSSVKQQYPVPVQGASAVIGHDACSGTFGFEDGRAYKLTFELFDSAGNHNAEKATLEVSAPRPTK